MTLYLVARCHNERSHCVRYTESIFFEAGVEIKHVNILITVNCVHTQKVNTHTRARAALVCLLAMGIHIRAEGELRSLYDDG